MEDSKGDTRIDLLGLLSLGAHSAGSPGAIVSNSPILTRPNSPSGKGSPASPFSSEKKDGFLSFGHGSLERQLVLLAIIVGIVVAFSWIQRGVSDPASRLRYGLLCFELVMVVLAFALLPRPAYRSIVPNFFALVQAMAFVYAINLLVFACLDSESLKGVLVALDPRLGHPVSERSYSSDCRVFTPENPTSNFANIRETVDVFVASHFIGWAVKTLVFRNNLVAWMLSITFELFELSFRHWLPNFYECWWDHLFLDLFGCNLLGILFTSYLMRKLGAQPYHWFFDPTTRTESMGRLRRILYSLTKADPHLESNSWHWLSSPSNFLSVTWLFALNNLTDLSNFFNKKMLNIPAAHYIMVVRIWILGPFSILAVSELYHFARASGDHKRITFNNGLSMVIVAAEIIVFVRNYRPEVFVQPTPVHVIAFWSVVAVVWVMLLLQSIRNSQKKLFKN